MDIVIWLLIIVTFILSFVGVIFPIIPSPLVLWIGFLLYYFLIDQDLTWIFWTVSSLLTIILIVSDIIANSYFVKKYGGSKWGERIAAIGVIIGSFIIPPFGIIIVPFLAVIAVELLQRRSTQAAMRAALGSLFGFLGGAFAKVLLQTIMIIWFVVAVIW